MVPEVSPISISSTTTTTATAMKRVSSSLRRRRRHEREELLQSSESENNVVIQPVHEVPQKLCASCHYSCLRCHGPEDFSCTACAPDSMFTRIDDKEAYCYPPASSKSSNNGDDADNDDATFFLARLNSSELLVVAIAFGGILFVICCGAYFCFRNICCDKMQKNKNYTYNALNFDDEQQTRLTYDRNSAIAFRREIDAIINEESSSISSCSEDEEDVLERVLNRPQ